MGADDEVTLAEQFRHQFGRADHLYACLLAEMADDWEAGGVTRELFAGWDHAEARQFPQLRLLAGLFRIVLRGDAPQLEGFYRVLGGVADHRTAWPQVRGVFSRHVAELRRSLDEAPQTNEPARTVAFLVGVSEALRRTGLRSIRLLEPGASAGLGLLVDRYRFVGDGWEFGPADASLVVRGCGARGLRPGLFDVVDRRGCDVSPVNGATKEGAAYLTSFVWPWQIERHRRLADALSELREHPVLLDRERASVWVAARLAEPVAADVLTVVWHSVTRLYWPAAETAAVTAAVDEARTRMPVAHVALEHPWEALSGRDDPGLPVVELDGEVLATADHHGPPVTFC
ncbi:MAG: DUF2332 domain-containing protein [Ornithinibacter sp.]